MKKYAAFAASVAISGAMLVGCGGNDDFCSSVSEDEAESFMSAGTDPDAAQEASDKLNDIVGDAPDEIQDDVQTLADFYGTLAEGETPSQDEATKVSSAGQSLVDWASENCE